MLKLRLVTPERKVLDVECDEAELPGELGYFGVLPGHTPLVAMLKIGQASYRVGKKESFVVIGGGLAEVSNDIVTVLCDFADLPAEIDLPEAQREQQAAEEELKQVGPDTFATVNARLETALARVQVASKR